MLTFTALDGNPVNIREDLVVRARRAIHGESIQLGAQTRIDWAVMQLVREPIQQVAAAIHAAIGDDFTHVTSKDKSEIWFAGPEATGPLPLVPSQAVGGVRSAIKLMGYRQYVTETPDEVRAILTAAHGTVLP
jgi:hypothetical protein